MKRIDIYLHDANSGSSMSATLKRHVTGWEAQGYKVVGGWDSSTTSVASLYSKVHKRHVDLVLNKATRQVHTSFLNDEKLRDRQFDASAEQIEQARQEYLRLKQQAAEAAKSATGKLRLQGLLEKMRSIKFQFGAAIADVSWEELFDSARRTR